MLYETKDREKYETSNVGYAYEIWRHGLPPFCLRVPPILPPNLCSPNCNGKYYMIVI